MPLDLVSVYPIEKPTYFHHDSVKLLQGRIGYLYPLRLWNVVQLIVAPLVFRKRLYTAFWKALTGPVEGWTQRAKMMAHLVPAIKLAFYWRCRNIGHVHCQWAHTAATIGMHAAELLGVGFSFMGHANDIFVHRVGLEDKLRRARFILCISEYHRRFYLNLGADPARLHVVYCGISLERFQRSSDLHLRSRRIVSVGRLVQKKGFDVLIRACGVLRDRGVEFECLIAGSGPLEDQLNRLIAEHHLQGYVEITGKAILQEEIPTLLRTARTFVLPCVEDDDGDMDGLPQVLIESMACGIPTVSTHLVGIPDLVRHEKNGLLVQTRSVIACANAIQALLEDDDLAARLGASGPPWARAHFGREELARRLEQVLCDATNDPGNAPPESLFEPAPGAADCYETPSFDRETSREPISISNGSQSQPRGAPLTH